MEEERKKRLAEELIIAKAEEAKKKKEAEELKKKAVEEWEAEEKKRKEKAKKAQEEADKEYNERMRKTLRANGYSEEEIDRMLKKAEKKEKGGQLVVAERHTKVVDLPRPTYMKVHTRYIDTYTLDTYDLPWDYDDVSFPPSISFLGLPENLSLLTMLSTVRQRLRHHQAVDSPP